MWSGKTIAIILYLTTAGTMLARNASGQDFSESPSGISIKNEFTKISGIISVEFGAWPVQMPRQLVVDAVDLEGQSHEIKIPFQPRRLLSVADVSFLFGTKGVFGLRAGWGGMFQPGNYNTHFGVVGGYRLGLNKVSAFELTNYFCVMIAGATFRSEPLTSRPLFVGRRALMEDPHVEAFFQTVAVGMQPKLTYQRFLGKTQKTLLGVSAGMLLLATSAPMLDLSDSYESLEIRPNSPLVRYEPAANLTRTPNFNGAYWSVSIGHVFK
jgi:hypothetical protein